MWFNKCEMVKTEESKPNFLKCFDDMIREPAVYTPFLQTLQSRGVKNFCFSLKLFSQIFFFVNADM